MLTDTDSLVLGDFNVHHSLWHSVTTDTRSNQLADTISISSFAVLNTDPPTRLPGNDDPSSPDVSLASASLITSSKMANTIDVCIWRMFVFVSVVVTVWGSVGMFVV